MGTLEAHSIAKVLKSFRRQGGFKQAAMADMLEISQAYYSRLEAGRHEPSGKLRRRIDALIRHHRHRPVFDQWRAAVRHATTCATIITLQDDVVHLVEISRGLRTLGGLYATIEVGAPLNNALGPDIEHNIARFKEVGAFDGAVVLTEHLWQGRGAAGRHYFRGVTSTVRDDFGRWHLHSNHEPLDAASYARGMAAGEAFKVVEE